MNNEPLIRPIKNEDASQFSPWPDRISGKINWSNSNRSMDKIISEYDKTKYESLISEWGEFKKKFGDKIKPEFVLSFFDKVERKFIASVDENKEVYGNADTKEYLISLCDQLYVADLNLFELFWRTFIVEKIYVAKNNYCAFDSILEIGCGNGINLFNTYFKLMLNSISGCDLSANAINFVNKISEDVKIKSTFKKGNFHDSDLIKALSPDDKWALLSVQAIEQTESPSLDWFKKLVDLKNPPQIGIHFEPLKFNDQTKFSEECMKYAEINGYNQDFLDTLYKAENEKILKITHLEKRTYGTTAHNPISVVMWRSYSE